MRRASRISCEGGPAAGRVVDVCGWLRRILEEHRAECEAQGKYVEAEIAKKRLDELQEQ